MSTVKDRRLASGADLPTLGHDPSPAAATASTAASDLEFVDLVSIVACKPNQSERARAGFVFMLIRRIHSERPQ